MQLGLPFGRLRPPSVPPASASPDVVTIDGHPVAVEFVRTRRAKHYILRVKPDGGLRVTVPWHGSRAEAGRFIEEREAWIARERHARAAFRAKPAHWADGTPVLFQGHEYPLRTTVLDLRRVRVSFADQTFVLSAERATRLKHEVETWLRRLASIDLPERLARLALQYGFDVKAVSIRNQRSRWGSCSPSGRISLNWRLIQFPAEVVDYVLVHELVHLRQMNHSRRFWTDVARLCPTYTAARAWLRAHGARG
ncbi:MAG: SprT family zinc-dependent metalloprotease [Vicinamibacterales bacterium]|nr:SprT family zinc-dependent metalloprotease [Vicinamibacterales bacterium]